MRNSMFSAGVYADLNPMYNEVCPPHHMEENLFQHHQSMAQVWMEYSNKLLNLEIFNLPELGYKFKSVICKLSM